MKNFIALWLVLLMSISLKGQSLTQTVKGQVLDQQAKSPIIGATILLQDADPVLGTVTDVDGMFRLENVPIGRHSFVLSSVGYETKTLSNIAVGSGKQVVLDVEMIESLTEMEAVEVVAERQVKGQPVNELATVSAISLSVEETSRYAATFDDPARAALSQAGVTTGGDDLLNEIVIRGNSPKGILWRLEGVEIPNPNHFSSVGSSAGGISMLSANVLSNSDFFTGAFPAQYGNATSGIFDLKMRKGNFDKREHALQVGLLGIAGASEGPFRKNSNASYLINYRYSTLALFDRLGVNILGDQEDITFQDLSFKVFLPTKKAGSFSIWGLAGANSYSYKADTVSSDDFYFEDEAQSMGATGITHMAYLGKNTYIESIASFSGYQQSHIEDSLRQQVYFSEDVSESQFRISSFINHKFNARNTLRIGGIYSRLNFNLKNEIWKRNEKRFVVSLDEIGSTSFFQSFAQWQYRIDEDFTINTGLHLSCFGLNKDTYVEPRIGFRWQATSRGAFTGGAGMHSRMETLSLYMASREEQGIRVQHNRDLGFTKALHGVLGYELMIKSDLKFKSEVYYQHLYDVPVWPSDTVISDEMRSFSAINTFDGYTSFELANLGTGKNYGVELTLEKFFSNSYYFLSTASLYQSKYRGIDGVARNTIFNGNYIFNLLGGKEFKLRNQNNLLSLNARFIFAGGKRQAPILLNESRESGHTILDRSRNFENKLDDYIRLDFGVSYKQNKKRHASIIAVNVQNVLGIENALGSYYSPFSDAIETQTQLGMFPNLSYKVEF